MTCSYCARPATATIIASPHQVCADHALEFWTGLLGYTHGRSSPCVKHQTLCTCAACEDEAELLVRSAAIRSVGPSPGDHEGFAIRLAS